MTLELLVGILSTAVLGSLSFFLVRFINKHDEFVSATRNGFNRLTTKYTELSTDVRNLEHVIEENGFDQKTKAQITLLSNRVNKLEGNLEMKLEPWVEQTKQNHGKILAFEQKLVTMFKTVQLLVNRQEKPDRE